MTYKEARAILPLEHICNEVARQKALEALDKQIPKKPRFEDEDEGLCIWICPHCNEYYEVDLDDYKHCPNCGQAIDWEGIK